MKKAIVHSLILITAVLTAFIFPKSRLVDYDFQIIAVLFIIYYLKKRLFVPRSSSYQGESRLLESVIFTLVILIIINTTGGALSQYFFLIYFLLFSLSLILEPAMSFVVSLSLTIFFLIDSPKGVNFSYYIPIFSLLFLTPFALFVGQEHLESLKSKVQLRLNRSQNSRLKEETLLFLSLMLKNHLKTIKQAVDNFVGDHQLTDIKKASRNMEKLIDKFENEI